MDEFFHKLAYHTSIAIGSPVAFATAVLVILVWTVTGPILGFSDSWQLVINTGTTIVTFLIVFLIQNTQNREAKVTQLKLDELLRSVRGARTRMVKLEELADEELAKLEKEFERLHERAEKHTETNWKR